MLIVLLIVGLLCMRLSVYFWFSECHHLLARVSLPDENGIRVAECRACGHLSDVKKVGIFAVSVKP